MSVREFGFLLIVFFLLIAGNELRLEHMTAAAWCCTPILVGAIAMALDRGIHGS